MEIIRSKSNSLVKEAKKLHLKKYRKQSYLIEGWHLLEEAQKSGAHIEHVFIDEASREKVLLETGIHYVSSEVLKDLADTQHPQGVVAQITMPVVAVPNVLKGRYLVVEDVQDPGNLGTMIRTADAAGYTAVFLSDKTVDVYNLKVLRSMQGSHFHLPIYRLPIEEILQRLQESQVPILATTLSHHSVDYKSVTVSESFAVVMGNEGRGISSVVASSANELIHISMPGQAESLNVAVAAGILLFNFI